MSIKSEEAVELFNSGFNCSQAVLAVFSEKYEMPKKLGLKIACGFGGGMRCGEVCGAVSGAVLVIGLKFGQSISEDKESKNKCYSETEAFTDKFKRENGSIICRDILGCDISRKQGMEQAMRDNLFKTICIESIISAVNILEKMGY